MTSPTPKSPRYFRHPQFSHPRDAWSHIPLPPLNLRPERSCPKPRRRSGPHHSPPIRYHRNILVNVIIEPNHARKGNRKRGSAQLYVSPDLTSDPKNTRRKGRGGLPASLYDVPARSPARIRLASELFHPARETMYVCLVSRCRAPCFQIGGMDLA